MSSAHPIIRLRPREGRRVRAGAPWAFSNEIVMDASSKALLPGTLVQLASDQGAALGTGYFNPKSLIAVRLLTKPGAKIDAEFFADRFRRALALREKFYAAPFYRLVHAEGDGLPGLVIDRFGETCVVQITTAGMEQLSEMMLDTLAAVIAPTTIILRNDVPARALEGLESYVRVVKGEAPAPLRVEENGAIYFADPLSGQKSGWYYDQRANRSFMAGLSKASRVLDAYCYSGGFAVLAAVNGANEVTGLDSSEAALVLASEAAAANGVQDRCRFVKCDIFAELERRANAGERFDVVICDPPPFAPAKKDVEVAARAYRKLARLAAGVVAPGGFLMLASCSHNISPERFGAECAAGFSRRAGITALIREAGAGPDHPVHPLLPETAYLKTLAYRVE